MSIRTGSTMYIIRQCQTGCMVAAVQGIAQQAGCRPVRMEAMSSRTDGSMPWQAVLWHPIKVLDMHIAGSK